MFIRGQIAAAAPAAPAADRLLGVPEVCARLSISRPTLYKLIREGDFPPPLKIGKCSRWRDSDPQNFIDGLATAERVASRA